ncbi:hypothetical protein GQX74_010578 [Glossina fuscipes]|nr:hypothetical protein GQX74_010578 [Glossina fuscipes]
MIRHNYNNRYAHKECGHDGEWFRHPLTNKTWSNYTKCVNIDDLELKHSVNLIYISGYSISLVAILLSLAILGYFNSASQMKFERASDPPTLEFFLLILADSV